MHPLYGPRLKLRRAEKHLNAIKAAIDDFIAKKPYTFVFEANPTPPNYIIVARVKQIAPDDELSVIIGDLAHNARSTLDLLVYQLSTLPPDDGRRGRLQFPIFDAPEKYRGKINSYLAMVAPEHAAIIEGFQPYKGLNGPDNDALGILAAINDADKHRIIHVVGTVLNFSGLAFSGPGRMGNVKFEGSGGIKLVGQRATLKIGDDVVYAPVGDGIITKDRTIVGKFTDKMLSQVEMNVHPEAEILIKFDEGAARVKGRPVMDTLTFVYDRVKEVIGKFEHVFPK